MPGTPNPALRSGVAAGIILALSGAVRGGENQGTAFVWQGEVRDAGALASGVYDVQFALYADANGVTQIGSTLCFDNIAITDGRIMQTLDFGAVFGPDKRYLAVSIRADPALSIPCSMPGGYTQVGPLNPVEAAPAAQFALGADTAKSVTNADSTSSSVPDTQNLGGHAPSYFTNAANLTGVLPGASLTGAFTSAVTLSNPANVLVGDGSGITGVVGSGLHVAHANTAANATKARDASTMANQPGSWYLNLGNHAGTPNYNLLNGKYDKPVSFTYNGNTYAGDGTALTGLNAGSINGVIPPDRIQGTYTGILKFNNPQNQWKGNGTSIGDLRLANLSGVVPPSNMPQMSSVISYQTGVQGFSGSSAGFVVIPASTRTASASEVPFAGSVIVNWALSAGTGAAQSGFEIAPSLDGAIPAGVTTTPMFFNTAGNHQFVGGAATYSITAGGHTFGLMYKKDVGAGNLEMPSDSISYTIIITR